MIFFGYEFGVGEAVGEEWVAAALYCFDDGEAEVFLDGGADDDVCLGEEREVVFTVFYISVMLDVVLELLDEGLVGIC